MRAHERAGVASPLDGKSRLIITNEHFFNRYAQKVQSIAWDLVVVDEAHKLRNVWRPGKKQAQRAKLIRETLKPFKKLLLTATPMQNNLMELYGLTSFIEEAILGTPESFQRTFQRIPEEERDERLAELKYRMQKFFHRELRKNVSDFIKYTKRNAVTFEFDPDDEEEQLRKDFEAYLTRDNNFGIPQMASHLLKLIYCKLLASSSFALKNSLLGIYRRFVLHAVHSNDRSLYENLIVRLSAALSTESRKSLELEEFEKLLFKNVRPKNFEGLRDVHAPDTIEDIVATEAEVADNYDDEDLEQVVDHELNDSRLTPEAIMQEAEEIIEFILLTKRIRENTKGDALKKALTEQFNKAAKEDWPQKAVIFTEFKTTQQYVINVLEQMGLTLERDIVIFNGSVGDAESRRALVQEFRDSKKIFLTTEAGAEGLNLQFCNLIINYDLPWNPQRIEQRIGRCHRYGQKLDVVVVNFVNKKNHADRRVLELLGEKFHLFEGAFGVSDEVLGEIQSGTDIEKEILSIYLSCRTPDQIDLKFREMFEKNRESVDARLDQARAKLLETFDEDVQKRLKDTHSKATEAIDAKQALVRDCLLSSLQKGDFEFDGKFLRIFNLKFGLQSEKVYTFSKADTGSAELIHASHPSFLAATEGGQLTARVKFIVSGHKISLLQPIVGSSGVFALYRIRLEGIESYDVLVPVMRIKDTLLDEEVAHKLFSTTSTVEMYPLVEPDPLITSGIDEAVRLHRASLLANTEELYHEEVEKIENLFDDLERQKRYEKDELQKQVEDLKKERRKLPLKAQSQINAEISKLKDKQLKLDEEIAEVSRAAREREKKLLAGLESKAKVSTKVELLASGQFEVA